MIKLLAKVNTVEEFWQVYSHLQPISNIVIKNGIHIFKNDSRAMREDPENINGGSFLIRITRLSPFLGPSLWEKFVLCLIGGQLPPDVIGITISPRPKVYNLSIWHQTAESPEQITALCQEIVRIVNIPANFKIDHSLNKDIGGESKVLVIYQVKEDHTIEVKK